MKLRDYALALVILLGCAYAKDKQPEPLHYPMAITVMGMNSPTATLGSNCFMTILGDDSVVYNVSSNGFCKTFNAGDNLHARVYDSKWGIRIMEILWQHDGKFKTAKYKVDSQNMR